MTPSRSGSGDPNVHGPPILVLCCCYTWRVIKYQFCRQWLISVSGSTLNINVVFKRRFYCINCIRCLAAGERALSS